MILCIIHRNQYGFLKGRTIQDCLAWAFEYIYQCQASKKEIVLLKLDFAKAFDTIDHAAMLTKMKNMGFNDKWLGWVQCIFGSGESAVLLNGVPGRQFHCKFGVRQGDPFSPLVFVLAADLSQPAINDAYTRGAIQLPFPSTNQMDYPVIQYANDTILAMPACTSQAVIIKDILSDYATSIGLKINFHKSTLMPINLDASAASSLAAVFGCSVGTMPLLATWHYKTNQSRIHASGLQNGASSHCHDRYDVLWGPPLMAQCFCHITPGVCHVHA